MFRKKLLKRKWNGALITHNPNNECFMYISNHSFNDMLKINLQNPFSLPSFICYVFFFFCVFLYCRRTSHGIILYHEDDYRHIVYCDWKLEYQPKKRTIRCYHSEWCYLNFYLFYINYKCYHFGIWYRTCIKAFGENSLKVISIWRKRDSKPNYHYWFHWNEHRAIIK